jgi:hypothetical protein
MLGKCPVPTSGIVVQPSIKEVRKVFEEVRLL